MEHRHSGRIGWLAAAGPGRQPPAAFGHVGQSDERDGNCAIVRRVALGGDGATVVVAGNGGGSGYSPALLRRHAHPHELRLAPRVGDRIRPVADSHVGTAGDAADTVAGVAVPRESVSKMERPVAGRHQVHLGHDLAVLRALVADMVGALPEHAPVLPPGVQAFGVPVVHPFAAAALTTGLGVCRKQQERTGEKRACCDSRLEDGSHGDSRAHLRSSQRITGGCATESRGHVCCRNQTDFPMGTIGNRYPNSPPVGSVRL